MSFIIVWNVAGELHKLKNMTRGSKSPQLVIKVAFHSSPLLILMLLKPHWRSRVENHLALQRQERTSEIRGKGYEFFTVISFSFR